MNKKSFIVILLLLTLSFGLIFSCKTKKEDVKETPKTQETTTQETTAQTETTTTETTTTTQTETVRKITDEEFQKAVELIEWARKAEADVYDKETFDDAVKNLKLARDNNDADPKKAFEYLELSKKQAEQSYYNAFKRKALLKKEEADKLFTQINNLDPKAAEKDAYKNAQSLYTEGGTAMSDEQYKLAYTKYYDTVEALKNVYSQSNQQKQEYESRIDFVKKLIEEAKKLGAEQYALDPYNLANEHLTSGIEKYTEQGIEGSKEDIDLAENYAREAIRLTNEALVAIKKKKALEAIKDAGKTIESVSGQPTLNEKGEAVQADPYQFEFNEEDDINLNNAPDSDVTSYQELLKKAIDYVEKAKVAYRNGDYDMAINYANIAKKIALSYKSTGIKTTYKVRLIVERRDCLWRISEYPQIYNNPFYWPLIWKTNKSKILNPDLIYPGQVFAIPEID